MSDKLTKGDIINYLKSKGIDASKKSIMRIDDHSNNTVAPEKYCYKISFVCKSTGKRRKLAVWPNTVGYQGY